MARFLLFGVVVMQQVSGSDPATGSTIDMYYDDSAFPYIVVKVNGVDTITPFSLGISGTHWRTVKGVGSILFLSKFVSAYSYCDGTALKWFTLNRSYPDFPFAVRSTTNNSPVCSVGGAVCDIIFNAPLQIINSTDLTSNNGQVVASAASSNGTVKYGLTDFDYDTDGQTSGTFPGLSPGFYTIYAKDANDCTAQLNFKILFKPAYAEHYRFTWSSSKIGAGTTRDSRVRIYEREYSGDLVEINYGDVSPFKLFKQKQPGINDKFFAVHTTNASLTLKSEVDYQFLPLFTQDNKKFKCVYEVDDGAGFSAVWSGFNLPSVYRELFVHTPYSVEFQITDNVVTLKDELFTDDNGNLLNGTQKLIKIISHVMKKTGLELNIRSGINIFETTHTTTATSDPLNQTYIDVACYRESDGTPFSCWRVLESILRPFGARVYQYENSWILEEIDKSIATYNYRVFDYNGDYVSNSSFNPIVDIKAPTLSNRVALSNVDHNFEIVPAYGKINVVSQLNYIGSVVSGGFEKNDLLSPEAETFDTNQGVFTTEEGFKDWTLRLNGTTGVSFGRVVIGTKSERVRQILKGDAGNSVGAFYFNTDAWSGNLRNAYIESSSKPYQYGPGDELKFAFEYSTPERGEFEFMVIRFAIKLGSNYLQQDLTWSTTEHIYRAYPKVSNSLQRLELSVPVPTTTVVVDSTIKVRIYFYSNHFFDYGIPSATSDPADGTDGISGLKGLTTNGVSYDYRADVRNEYGSPVRARRLFYELRVDAANAEDSPNVIRPTDYNASTNKKVWWLLKSVVDNNEITNRSRGLDVKYYVDNVSMDALINGQPPPTEETITLNISRYINEYLDVDLYNFDVPNIVNAKNMYNNFFRREDGSPTTLWTRTGIAEALPLQQILLKVLGANHSAPTFRLTGSFLNEFARIGINNYIRLTKTGSSLTVLNTEFTTNLNLWSQTGAGESFVWTASNSGSAEVVLSGAEDSKKIYQVVTHSGGYIKITINVHVEPSAGNDREDVMWVLFWNGASIVHMEKLKSFAKVSSANDYTFTYVAFMPGQITQIGFFFKNVNGTGSCTYQVGQFKPEGSDVIEVYQIADYTFDERMNSYQLELMQLSKTYISLQGTDQGGTNQGGGTQQSFDGAYSSAYGGSFDTILI